MIKKGPLRLLYRFSILWRESIDFSKHFLKRILPLRDREAKAGTSATLEKDSVILSIGNRVKQNLEING